MNSDLMPYKKVSKSTAEKVQVDYMFKLDKVMKLNNALYFLTMTQFQARYKFR